MIFAQCDIDEMRATVLVIVVEHDNLDRMRTGDPITLEMKSRGGYLRPVKYPDGLQLLIAHEEDTGRIYEMIQNGKVGDLIKHLMRGYKFKGNDGKAAMAISTKKNQ